MGTRKPAPGVIPYWSERGDPSARNRPRVVIAVVAYGMATALLSLLPIYANADLRPYARAWLEPAHKMTWKVFATESPAIKTMGVVCAMGILGLPFLGAALVESRSMRIMFWAVGLVMLTAYIGLALFSFGWAHFSPR